MASGTRRGDLWLLPIAVLAVSSAAILIRLTPADPVAIAFWRLFLATAITAAAAYLGASGIRVGRWWPLAVAGGVLLAVHFLTWIASVFYTTIAISTTLVNLHPIIMLAISRYGLGERITARTAAGAALSAAGGAVIASAAAGLGGANPLGALLAFIGAVAFAGYLAVGRAVRASADTLSYTAVAYGSAAAVSLAVAAALKAPVFGYGPKVYLLFAAIAVVPMLLGHSVFNYLLGRHRAIAVAVSALGEPVGATLLAIPIFSQVPTPTAAAGMALALAGIGIVAGEEAGLGGEGRARGGRLAQKAPRPSLS
nr:MAG: multidrug transporter [Thermoproteus sp. AZ2]